MGYKYEQKLLGKANNFIEKLQKAGYKSGINMIRDYMIKLEIVKEEIEYGNAVIYYKPSKDSFSLKTHELQEELIVKEIQQIWNNRLNNTVTGENNFDDYHIYVDGSYMNGQVGYGFVVLKNNEIIKEKSGTVNDPDYIHSHQVGGEIKAVEKAVLWAEDKGIKKIYIYYDLANLEKWITGEYKAKNPMTKQYRDEVRKTDIDIIWKKVESHTGDQWNDYADKLAKKGTKA